MFDAGRLTQRLAELIDLHGTPQRMLVGFSGGVDSAVLLHALVASRPPADIVALHVDHGLHSDSRAWADSARAFARRLGVDFICVEASVEGNHADGPEAAARSARYAAFEACLGDGDWLVSAHHADDQAETLLLNLMRGSGPLGLAGMQTARPLGRGVLVRPLLDVSRAEITDYAAVADVRWTEDPSNSDTRFDRNFLRHRILPILGERWPAVTDRLAKSAGIAAETQELLDELARSDLEEAGCPAPHCIAVAGLAARSRPRQRNLLRHACRRAGLPLPPARRLEAVLDDTVPAAASASPCVCWPGAEVRRYRDTLFLLAELGDVETPTHVLVPGKPLPLGAGLGSLELERSGGRGIDPGVARQGLSVGFRQGGERLRPAMDQPTRELKKLLQEACVLPWMRSRIPLLYAGDKLVAVADLWIDAQFFAEDGYQVVWNGPPVVCWPAWGVR